MSNWCTAVGDRIYTIEWISEFLTRRVYNTASLLSKNVEFPLFPLCRLDCSQNHSPNRNIKFVVD